MYISTRANRTRNLAIALVNGAITLVILLIAPLGLVAVVINTVSVTLATYLTAVISDRIILYVQGSAAQRAELVDRAQPQSGRSQLRRSASRDVQRWDE